MKAIVYHTYGSPDVLRCEEIEPPAVGDDQVLIRVRAAAANPLDVHFVHGTPYFLRVMSGLRAPKDPGVGRDVAGEVQAVGRGVTDFAPGDAVFGTCRGAFAEFAGADASALVAKPASMTFEQAAAIPVAGVTALQALRDAGRLRAGQAVLINAAAGGVGTFAVQIAKALGAEVTGVCSTRNVEFVRSLGADHVLDYTVEDFADGGARYDLIVDCHATHSLSALRRALQPKGTYVGVGGPVGSTASLLADLIKQLTLAPFVSQKFATFIAKLTREDLIVLRDMVEAGTVTPVVDRRYALDDAAEAIRHLEGGHARGKVVITM